MRLLYSSGPRFAIVVAISCLILPAIILIIGHVEGNFLNEPLDLDLSEDWGFVAQYFVLMPATILGMGILAGQFPSKLAEWAAAGHFRAKQDTYNEIISRGNYLYAHWAILVATLGFACVTIVYGAYLHTFSPKDTWHSNVQDPFGTIAGWAVLPIRFLLYFGLVELCLKTAISVLVYTRILRSGLNVRIFHADSCGGLSLMGKYWIRNYISILVVGFLYWLLIYIVQTANWLNPLAHLFILAIYCLAILAGFTPLFVTHRAMQRAKEEKLKHPDEQIEQGIARLMFYDKNTATDNEFSQLERSLKIRSAIGNMAVWPYNFRNLSFLTVTVVPGIPTLLKLYNNLSAFLQKIVE